ncbi:WD40 repeat domain-containing protein [Campylobacter sputorum]|uniref:WD40 repeat domain-containing protein n=1 Tax=Campylobacter sputorum TaxID=206 RepID=UPI000B795302|nr:WD40 repeat domain-containing protein [Campylobacter sputorum]ASM36425.1 nitrate reductase accessory protein [Campylobacter sputorum bv. faecalis CCUG 20703]
MIKNVILFLIFLTLSYGIEPYDKIELSSNAMSMNLDRNLLFIATDNSSVEVYDINLSKMLEPIKLPYIKTYFSDEIPAKTFSIDTFKDKVMILHEEDFGKKAISLYKKSGLNTINLKNESIKKALFLDENTALLASISNEIYYFDINSSKVIFSFKFSTAALGDITLSKDKKMLYVADEGGTIYVFDTQKKEIVNKFNAHKDSVYSIDCGNSVVVTGSADKNIVVIKDLKMNFVTSSFLVYCVGISSSGKVFAYMDGENSDITIRDTLSMQKITTLQTSMNTINSIIFIDDATLIASGYGNEILFWRFR